MAVFEILETGFDGQGQPVRLTVSIYPTDRNQFAVDVGEVPDEAVPSDGQGNQDAETASPDTAARKRGG